MLLLAAGCSCQVTPFGSGVGADSPLCHIVWPAAVECESSIDAGRPAVCAVNEAVTEWSDMECVPFNDENTTTTDLSQLLARPDEPFVILVCWRCAPMRSSLLLTTNHVSAAPLAGMPRRR